MTGARGGGSVGGCHDPPPPPDYICILPTFICLLLALLTIGTYPSFSLLLIDKLTKFDLIIWKVISITRGAINSDQPKAYNTRHKSLKQGPFVLNFLQISYIHS